MRFLLAIFVFFTLAGCATRPPSSCDGSQRRPINSTSHAGYFLSCGTEMA